jgi:hypothetical protein
MSHAVHAVIVRSSAESIARSRQHGRRIRLRSYAGSMGDLEIASWRRENGAPHGSVRCGRTDRSWACGGERGGGGTYCGRAQSPGKRFIEAAGGSGLTSAFHNSGTAKRHRSFHFGLIRRAQPAASPDRRLARCWRLICRPRRSRPQPRHRPAPPRASRPIRRRCRRPRRA